MKPTNNKSMFHTAAKIVADLDEEKRSHETVDLKLKALKQMSLCLDYELKRVKVAHETGQKEVKIRNIEINNFEDE